jgi:phospholysine phosphohistidine inorganic pyrophosphate phosphatase
MDLDFFRAYFSAAITGYAPATWDGGAGLLLSWCTTYKGHGMPESLGEIKGVLLDLDGTIFVGDRLVPGAADAVGALRRGGLPLRFNTNTTRMSRLALVGRLREMGLELEVAEVFTAPLAAASWLEKKGLWNLALCVPEVTHVDFGHFKVNETSPQAVVVGDLGEGWDFARLNQAFQHIMEGAEFVALQRNRYWDTGQGLALDAGAFVTALEYATGREAVLVGKPSPTFFQVAAESMGVDLLSLAVVGDDPDTDVAGAHACDAAAILVRTGRFRERVLPSNRPQPDLILDSVAALPAALGVGF